MENQANKGDSKADAKSEHKTETIWRKWGEKSVLDVLMYICATLVAVGGLWLGYLGVSGHLKSQQVLGLWVLYGTLFFVLTGGFLYFYQRLQNQEAQSVKGRPYVFFKLTMLKKPLTVGEKTVIQFVLGNSGQAEAHVKFWDNTYYFNVRPFKNSFEYIPYPTSSYTLVPNAEVNGELRYDFVVTKEKLEALQNDAARLYFFTRGEYQGEDGTVYPLPFCRMYDKDFIGNLIVCPDDIKIQTTGEKKPNNENPN